MRESFFSFFSCCSQKPSSFFSHKGQKNNEAQKTYSSSRETFYLISRNNDDDEESKKETRGREKLDLNLPFATAGSRGGGGGKRDNFLFACSIVKIKKTLHFFIFFIFGSRLSLFARRSRGGEGNDESSEKERSLR